MPSKNDLPKMAVTTESKLAVHYRPRTKTDHKPWVHEHTGARFDNSEVDKKPRQATVTSYQELKGYDK